MSPLLSCFNGCSSLSLCFLFYLFNSSLSDKKGFLLFNHASGGQNRSCLAPIPSSLLRLPLAFVHLFLSLHFCLRKPPRWLGRTAPSVVIMCSCSAYSFWHHFTLLYLFRFSPEEALCLRSLTPFCISSTFSHKQVS